MDLSLPGGLTQTQARFLSQYWQKKPLLVRQVIPTFADIVQPSTLFHLAARENVESRLFVRRGSRWTACDDPLNALTLCSLLYRWYLNGWLLIGEWHG